MNCPILDQAYLEYSTITSAKTQKECRLENQVNKLTLELSKAQLKLEALEHHVTPKFDRDISYYQDTVFKEIDEHLERGGLKYTFRSKATSFRPIPRDTENTNSMLG